MSLVEKIAVQHKVVESVDINAERTRVYFERNELVGTADILTLLGMSYALLPGCKVKVTVELQGE